MLWDFNWRSFWDYIFLKIGDRYNEHIFILLSIGPSCHSGLFGFQYLFRDFKHQSKVEIFRNYLNYQMSQRGPQFVNMWRRDKQIESQRDRVIKTERGRETEVKRRAGEETGT